MLRNWSRLSFLEKRDDLDTPDDDDPVMATPWSYQEKSLAFFYRLESLLIFFLTISLILSASWICKNKARPMTLKYFSMASFTSV